MNPSLPELVVLLWRSPLLRLPVLFREVSLVFGLLVKVCDACRRGGSREELTGSLRSTKTSSWIPSVEGCGGRGGGVGGRGGGVGGRGGGVSGRGGGVGGFHGDATTLTKGSF